MITSLFQIQSVEISSSTNVDHKIDITAKFTSEIQYLDDTTVELKSNVDLNLICCQGNNRNLIDQTDKESARSWILKLEPNQEIVLKMVRNIGIECYAFAGEDNTDVYAFKLFALKKAIQPDEPDNFMNSINLMSSQNRVVGMAVISLSLIATMIIPVLIYGLTLNRTTNA